MLKLLFVSLVFSIICYNLSSYSQEHTFISRYEPLKGREITSNPGSVSSMARMERPRSQKQRQPRKFFHYTPKTDSQTDSNQTKSEALNSQSELELPENANLYKENQELIGEEAQQKALAAELIKRFYEIYIEAEKEIIDEFKTEPEYLSESDKAETLKAALQSASWLNSYFADDL